MFSACYQNRSTCLASPFRDVRKFGATLCAVGLMLSSLGLSAAHGQDDFEGALTMLRAAESKLEQENFAEAVDQALAVSKRGWNSARFVQTAAEILYRAGEAKQSLPLFDRVIELDPESAPYNWQRGLALCSCAQWEAGAEQFKTHHDVNPDDVENSAWYFLCVAKSKDLDAARKTVIPSRGDGRQPMMSVLGMLKGELAPDKVLDAAKANTSPGPGQQRACFYADLYVGLYYDSINDKEQAIKYLKRSLSYETSGYMRDSARVYLADRFAKSTPAE